MIQYTKETSPYKDYTVYKYRYRGFNAELIINEVDHKMSELHERELKRCNVIIEGAKGRFTSYQHVSTMLLNQQNKDILFDIVTEPILKGYFSSNPNNNAIQTQHRR